MTDGFDVGLKFEKAYDFHRRVRYGEQIDVPVWIRNSTSDPMHVRSVSLRVQADPGVLRLDEHLIARLDALAMRLPPGGHDSVSIPVVPPLFCLPHSNSLTVMATYESEADHSVAAVQEIQQQQFDWILVEPVPPPQDSEVFVSFADPEDLALAELLAEYLRRAGFRPYMARADHRPGCDLWAHKIEPAIERSQAVHVIWTKSTEHKPDSVRREIRLARVSHKPVVLFRGSGADLPSEYPSETFEYHQIDPGAPYLALANVVAAACKRRRAGEPTW